MKLHLELEFKKGDLVTLYGESGAGKTSTLRMLAGLLTPDRGRIVVGGQTWFDSGSKINLRPQQRKLGFVFQDYALFPHMTVRENLEYGLKSREDKNIVSHLIELVSLEDLQDRRPVTLSGGQKQRVALARALINQPSILLADEPTGNLDSKSSLEVMRLLTQTHEQGQTVLVVTHDPNVASIAQRVVFMKDGQITHETMLEDQPSSRRLLIELLDVEG